MKKYSALLLLLLCSTQITHSGDTTTSSSPEYYILKSKDLGAVYAIIAGGALALSFIGYKFGQYSNNSKVEIALKKADVKRIAQQEKEKAQQKKEAVALAQFHVIENIKLLTAEFKDLKAKHPRPENCTDHQQQQILALMIAQGGSVGKFADKIADHINAYNNFDQTTSIAHSVLYNDLLWLQRSLNIPCVQIKKNQEWNDTMTRAKFEAEVSKAKHEARAAQNLVEATQQTKQMIAHVESTVNRTTKDVRDVTVSMRNEYRAHESTMNHKLAAITDAHARPASEHKEILEVVYDLRQQLNRVTAIANNTQKNTQHITGNVATITKQQEDKIKQLEEQLKQATMNEKQQKDLAKELTEGLNKAHQEIDNLKRPQPSAPHISQLYPSLHATQYSNPPAQNPHYRDPRQGASAPAL